jgi:hypothetical protein
MTVTRYELREKKIILYQAIRRKHLFQIQVPIKIVRNG